MLLGPAGVGLIGLFQSLMATGSAISALGFGTVGTRQIAEAVGDDDPPALEAARRSLFWGTLGLALIGATVFWLLRDVLAEKLLGDPEFTGEVGWLAIGRCLDCRCRIAGSIAEWLPPHRRHRPGPNFVGCDLRGAGNHGIVEVGRRGHFGLHHLRSLGCLPRGPLVRVTRTQGISPTDSLAAISRPVEDPNAARRRFHGSGSDGVYWELGRAHYRTAELGTEALGHFQAAWMISMTYIGFVLQAMGTDYYPRLTAVIRDHVTANRLVNEQSEVALLLAGPVFVIMLGLAPWIIELLYSDQFAEAVSVLRWQVLGDILKVASWPMGFIILAAGDGRTFMLTESLSIAVFVGLTWIGLPLIGIDAVGIAFVGMYALLLPLVFVLARHRTGFAWERSVHVQFLSRNRNRDRRVLGGTVVEVAWRRIGNHWRHWPRAAWAGPLAAIWQTLVGRLDDSLERAAA